MDTEYKSRDLRIDEVGGQPIFSAYEITCPFCQSKMHFESELVDSFSIFCSFCHQKLNKGG